MMHTHRGHQTLNATLSGEDTYLGPSEIRVFLLDDHEVVRAGVRGLLETDPRITVVGEAASVAAAIQGAPSTRASVALLDVRLPDGSGIAACRELRSLMPQLRCLMMTSFSDDEALAAAVMAGASGYVLKQIRGTDIVGAVRSVAAGGSAMDSETTSAVMRLMRQRAARLSGLEAMAQSERELLELVGAGMTNRDIAESLGVAEKTVRNRVSLLLDKLGISRRAQASDYVKGVRSAVT